MSKEKCFAPNCERPSVGYFIPYTGIPMPICDSCSEVFEMAQGAPDARIAPFANLAGDPAYTADCCDNCGNPYPLDKLGEDDAHNALFCEDCWSLICSNYCFKCGGHYITHDGDGGCIED